MSSDTNNYNQYWGSFNFFTYALLKPGATRQAFQKKVDQTVEKFVKPVFDPFGVKMRFYAQPIVDIHLHSALEREPEELGSMSYIWTFSAVAFFMLLIACINYMNLTTARSARRAKEIGIRKVTGSRRGQLIAQFLGEPCLLRWSRWFSASYLSYYYSPSSIQYLENRFQLRPCCSLSIYY